MNYINEKEQGDRFNFRVIDLGQKIDLPIFSEKSYREWIDYGYDNLFPQFLTDIYNWKSITHKTIIRRKTKMVSGEGFEETPENKDIIKNFYSEDTLDDILRKVSYDFEIYDSFALNVLWNRTGDKVVRVEHIPAESIRMDKHWKGGEKNYYWVSKDWSNTRRWKPEKWPCFSKKYLNENENSQILYYREYQPGSRIVYPIPSYYSSINWVLAEWEISNFHRASIQNGFNAGFLLNFSTGIPTPEEMERAYREIEDKYTGTFNAGKFILTFSNGKEQEPKLEPIPLADTDARYKELNDLIKENIFTANEVTTPELFGVATPGQLGTKDQLLEGLEIFQSVYINDRQKQIENVFKKIFNIDFKIKKYVIDIQKINGEV
jgi:hypothetical protein